MPGLGNHMSDSSPLDFFKKDTEYVDGKTYNQRMLICKKCPLLIPVINQCRQCGCFMNLKAKIKHAICPIGNW
jgi:hypothetical protein